MFWLLTSHCIIAQTLRVQSIELNKVIIKNDNLTKVIANSIEYIKCCENYHDSLLFIINAIKKESDIYIDFTYATNLSVALDLEKNPYGFFNYKTHYFFLYCNDSLGLFEKTNETKYFEIDKVNEYLMVEDRPEWLYKLKGSDYLLIEMINQCMNEKGKIVKFKSNIK